MSSFHDETQLIFDRKIYTIKINTCFGVFVFWIDHFWLIFLFISIIHITYSMVSNEFIVFITLWIFPPIIISLQCYKMAPLWSCDQLVHSYTVIYFRNFHSKIIRKVWNLFCNLYDPKNYMYKKKLKSAESQKMLKIARNTTACEVKKCTENHENDLCNFWLLLCFWIFRPKSTYFPNEIFDNSSLCICSI